MYYSSLLLVLLVPVCWAYPKGPPIADHPTLCQSMFPTGHNTQAQNSTAPYKYVLSDDCFKAGSTIEVQILSTHKDEASRYFEGFFTQVVKNNDNSTNYGVFTTEDDEYSKPLDCFGKTNSSIGQHKKEHFASRIFQWIAPASGLTTNVYFRSTIVKGKTTFWTEFKEEIKYDVNCAGKGKLVNAKATLQDRTTGSHENTGDGGKAPINGASFLMILAGNLLFVICVFAKL